MKAKCGSFHARLRTKLTRWFFSQNDNVLRIRKLKYQDIIPMQFDSPAILFHELFDDEETQARTFFAVAFFEYFSSCLLLKTRAVVRKSDNYVLPPTYLHENFRCLSVLDGVLDQVPEECVDSLIRKNPCITLDFSIDLKGAAQLLDNSSDLEFLHFPSLELFNDFDYIYASF
jgi:hypothetical protein